MDSIEAEIANGIMDLLNNQNELLYALSKIAIFVCANKDNSYMVCEEIEILRNFIEESKEEENDD